MGADDRSGFAATCPSPVPSGELCGFLCRLAAEGGQYTRALVLFGSDIDPTTLLVRDPQTFTLVEADASPEAGVLAVLDMQIAGNFPLYRALPGETLFGEVPGVTPP